MTKNFLEMVEILGAQAGEAPPEWFRLLPLGEVRAVNRPSFSVDRAALERLVAAFRERGNDLVIDYEHQTMTGEQAPAAGWIKDLEVRDDGLWAKVEWTAKAREYLQNREYRYFSPVMQMNKETGAPLALYHVGLTNFPAINDLPALVAKMGGGDDPKAAQQDRAKKYGIGVKDGGHVTKPGEWAQVPDAQFADPVNYRYPMPDHDQCQAAWSYWNHPKNQEQYTPEERGSIEKRIRARAKAVGMTITQGTQAGTPAPQEARAMKNRLLGVLALKAEATDDEIFAALQAKLALAGALPEICQVLALKADATVGEVIGAIKGLKDGQDRLQTVETKLAALTAVSVERDSQEAVEAALKAGKAVPAEKEYLLKEARADVAAFKARMEARPVIGPPLSELPKQPGPEKGAALDAGELAVCKQLGLDPNNFKATRDQMAGAQ
ncbi:MAG: hypothetical protein HY743_09840 [Deltaproteobacteria bacterium]|nr:hypothetical protein [Deltaproteobacteria bacterium]